MAVRRESVVLDLDDRVSPGLLRVAASAEIADRSLEHLGGQQLRASASARTLENDTDRLSQRVDRSASSIDSYSGRLGLLGDALTALGPAAIPIGAAVIPAVTGLTEGLGAAVVGVGVAELAFHDLGSTLQAVNKASLDPTVANVQSARLALDKLSPSTRQLVLELHALSPELAQLREAAASGLAPGVTAGLRSLLTDAPLVEHAVRGISAELGGLASEAGRSLASDEWRPFLRFAGQEAPIALGAWAKATGHVAHGGAEIFQAFAPLNHEFDAGILRVAADFDRWASSLDRSRDFQAFLDYIETNGPRVVEMLGDTAHLVGDVVAAAAPLGGPTLRILDLIVKVLDAIANTPAATPLLAMAQLNGVIGLTNRGLQLLGVDARIGFSGVTRGAQQSEAAVGGLRATALAAASTLRTMAGNKLSGQPLALGVSSENLRSLSRAGLLVGGLGLAASGATQKLHLENTATLAIAGSMAGPWGTAIGAGIGFLLDFTTHQDRSAAATADFTSTLNQQTGAITGNTRAMAAQVLQQDGAFEAAKKLGIPLDTVTSAALGQKQALEDLNDQLAFFLHQTTPGYTAGGASVVSPEETKAVVDLQHELGILTGRLGDDQAKTRELAAATSTSGDAADAARRKHHQLRLELQAEIAAARQTAQSFLTLGDHVNDAKVSLDQWVHQLAAQARALEQFGDNAKRAADKGLRDGLIAELQKAGPEGALRMRQLANASQTEIAKANRAWDSGKRAANDYQSAVAYIANHPPVLSVHGVPQSLSEIRQVQTALAQLRDRTVTVTTRHITGGSVKAGNAAGGYISGPGGPTDDQIPAWLSNGEYVMRAAAVDRYGLAMMHALNAGAYADGGPVGPSTSSSSDGLGSAAGRLARFQHALDLASHSLDAERQHRDDLLQAEQRLAQAVRDNFRSQVFGATADGGIWTSGTSTDPAHILRQDIRNAREYRSDLLALRRRGLRGGALAEVDTLAEAQQAMALPRSELRQISRLFQVRQRASTAAGRTAGQLQYGQQIDAVRNQIVETNKRVRQLTNEVKGLRKDGPKNARLGGQEVRKSIRRKVRQGVRRAGGRRIDDSSWWR